MARGVPVVLLAVPLAVAAACDKPAAGFRHAAHVAVTKGSCAPCHGSDAAAPRPAADADCAACHKQALEPSQPGAGAYRVGRRTPGSAASPGAPRAAFAHGPHAAANIACAACHADSRWRGNRCVPPTPEECSSCHSQTR
ncbi:MAG: hypothetical protein ACM3NF_07615 [Gemmatimonadota bacterium]